MSINEIHTKIANMFGKYKIPAITNNIKIEDLHRWSSEVAKHFNLDEDDFGKEMSELFWSVAHVQLSLGYALIARQDCEFPNGTSGTAFKEEDMPNPITLPEIHFWYHLYNSYECIYRCWERMASVLKYICYPQNNNKMYFDQVVNVLDNDGNFNKNPHIEALKNQIKHWNKAAKARNEISHGKSSPFRNMCIEGKLSDLLGMDGLPLGYANYTINSPRVSLEQVVDKYKKVFPAMKIIVDFIDNIDR